jgi:hypothetical protein
VYKGAYASTTPALVTAQPGCQGTRSPNTSLQQDPKDPKGRCEHGQWQSMAKPFSSPLLPSKMRRLRCRRQTARLYWKNLYPPSALNSTVESTALGGLERGIFLFPISQSRRFRLQARSLYPFETGLVDSIDSMPLSCHEIF